MSKGKEMNKGMRPKDSCFPKPLNFLLMLLNLDAVRLKHERNDFKCSYMEVNQDENNS